MVTALRRYALSVSLVLFQGALFTAPPDAQNRVSPTPGPIAAEGGSEKEPPREWIDPDTGHRVVRLSDEPGSQSLYFHQNAYTPDGTRLIITTPTGLATINLKTRAIEKVVEGRVPEMNWRRASGPGITWSAASGRSISTSRRMERSSPATAADRQAWPRRATASGFTSSAPSSCRTAPITRCRIRKT